MTYLVLVKNNTAVCSTLQVSEKFHKRHSKVIRALEDIMKNDLHQNWDKHSAQNWAQYFKEASYKVYDCVSSVFIGAFFLFRASNPKRISSAVASERV